MPESTPIPWGAIERRGPALFLTAGILLLVAAVYYAVPLLLENITVSSWIGLTVLVGRLVTLLGIAGLTAGLVNQSSRAAKVARIVVAAAVAVTSGLLVSAVLENFGVGVPIIAVFGLGTIILSIITYGVVGALILRTGVHDPVIGGLLLAATGGLLFGFFGQAAFPENVVGAVVESVLAVTSLAIGYRLKIGAESAPPSDVVSETPSR